MNQIAVSLLMLDGTSAGAIRYYVRGWDLVAYRIPRADLDKHKDRVEMNYSGIYFLFGRSEATGEQVVYVGQASHRSNGNGILGRVKEHTFNSADETFWNEAVIFTPCEDRFTTTDLCYLEKNLYLAVAEANICRVVNDTIPQGGNPSEEELCHLTSYMTWIKTITEIMRYNIFDSTEKEMLYCNIGDCVAKGRRLLDGFLILKGSQISATETSCCSQRIKEIRRNLKMKDGVLEKNYKANSPSEAASIVCGGSINGMKAWTTQSGILIKDLI